MEVPWHSRLEDCPAPSHRWLVLNSNLVCTGEVFATCASSYQCFYIFFLAFYVSILCVQSFLIGGGGTWRGEGREMAGISVQTLLYLVCYVEGNSLKANRMRPVRVHGRYGDICMCVFCVHRRSEGVGRSTPGAPFSQSRLVNEAFFLSRCLGCLPRGWQRCPIPSSDTHCSHPQSWHTAKQYVWQWLSHEHKPSNQLRINIFFHYIPCNPEGKKGIETNFPLCLVLYSA